MRAVSLVADEGVEGIPVSAAQFGGATSACGETVAPASSTTLQCVVVNCPTGGRSFFFIGGDAISLRGNRS
jgi:hypothetical protein